MGKKTLKTATKTGLDLKLDLKTASKKVIHKTAEATRKFTGHETANKIMKPKPVLDENARDAEEIFIPSEKRE